MSNHCRKITSILAAIVLVSISLIGYASGMAVAVDDGLIALTPTPLPTVDLPELNVQVSVGFDGVYQLNAWTPVRIEVENLGNSFEGNLVVPVLQSSNTYLEYAMPVEIPSGSTKSFTIMIMPKMAQSSICVELEQNDDVISRTYSDKLTYIAPEYRLLGTLSEDSESLSYWKDRTSDLNIFKNMTTVALNGENVPVGSQTWESFALLVVDNFDIRTLSSKQQAALKEWSEQGGIIIVGSGGTGQKTLQGLQDIVDISSEGIVTASGVGQLLGDTAGVTPPTGDPVLAKLSIGGETLLIVDQNTVISTYQIGGGQILVSAFELGTRPINDWRGALVFWEKILQVAGVSDQIGAASNARINYGYDRFGSVLQNIPALDLPAMSLIFIILIIFILIVGPVGYWVLKRKDKRDWAWFLIPAVTVVFSAGIFLLGYRSRGTEPVSSTFSLLKPDNNGASAEMSIGVMVPSKGNYNITTQKEGYADTYDIYYDNYSSQFGAQRQRENATRLLQGANNGLASQKMSAWTMSTFQLTTRFEDVGKITGTLVSDENNLAGTLTNETGFDLDQVIIFGPSGYQSISYVLNGDSFEVSLDSNTKQTSGYVSERFYTMIEELFPYSFEYNSYGNLVQNKDQSEEERRTTLTRRYILQGLQEDFYYENTNQSANVKIIAFTMQAGAVPVQLNEQTVSTNYHQAAIMQNAVLSFESNGQINLPNGFVRGVLDQTQSSNNINTYDSTFGFEIGNSAVFSLTLPDYDRYNWETAAIQAQNYYYNNVDLVCYLRVKAEQMTDENNQGLLSGITAILPGEQETENESSNQANQLQAEYEWIEYKLGTSIEKATLQRALTENGSLIIKVELDESSLQVEQGGRYYEFSIPTITAKGRVK